MAQPILGPGEEIAPLDPSLPYPISNPRVASNNGRALVVWVDAPFTVMRAAGPTPESPPINDYRQRAPRLKGKLLATLGDVTAAPVLDLGEGTTPAPADFPDRYDNSFRVLPLGEGFVVIGYHERPTRRLIARTVSDTGIVGEAAVIDPASVSEGGAPFSLALAHDGWDALVHDEGIAIVGKRGAGLGVLQVSAELQHVSGRTISSIPPFDRIWTGVGGAPRARALLERGSPTNTADPDRALIVVQLPNVVSGPAFLEIPRPITKDSLQRRGSSTKNWVPYCTHCGDEGGVRPPSLAGTPTLNRLILDDGDALIPISNVPGPSLAASEPRFRDSTDAAPFFPPASTLCGDDGRALRLFQSDHANSMGGPRAEFLRPVDEGDPAGGAPRLLLASQTRIGPTPCGSVDGKSIVVDRGLSVHAFLGGFASAATSITSMPVQRPHRIPGDRGVAGGRSGLIRSLRSTRLFGVGSSANAVVRSDLLGRELDEAPVALGEGKGWRVVRSITSTPDWWFLCSDADGPRGRTTALLHRLATRGPPDERVVEVAQIEGAANTSCLLQVVGDRLEVFWRQSSDRGTVLWHRTLSLDLAPLSPEEALASAGSFNGALDVAVPDGDGLLIFLSDLWSPQGAFRWTRALGLSRFTTEALTSPPVASHGGWLATTSAGAGVTDLIRTGASGSTERWSLPPGGSASSFYWEWDGVGLVGGGGDSFSVTAIGDTGVTTSVTRGLRNTEIAFEGEVVSAGVGNWWSLASTWGGVGFALETVRTVRLGENDISESHLHALHRHANVTADHQELTVRNQAAHAITLGPPTHEGQPQTFEIHVPPLHGTASLDANVATYLPEDDSVGEDSFFFTVTGPDGSKRAFTIVLHVEPGDPVSFATGGCDCDGASAGLLALFAALLPRRRRLSGP